ncbi:flavin reductase family protein [Truepera radiovictrix]|uniref:Flavin reductase domain protein FMN-binding protein n=1 Tax=Truepera radiovictrix (strain DSM 17093 / CIP 108686 / LMG 22925 / RQ-24) TaxID=649638 RepID=D7CUG9_TRURR|nr:flavin reductase family protein [Truepera radiovictrix]ADI15754.1 flavin reductase domain protein FMN-binding protein [Truepera radiovictrix DSM 17093]WMT58619.1 flavin reductase family protein [Truepera radiovictrix]
MTPPTHVDVAALGAQRAYKLLTSAVIPRPIAWVSTVSKGGVPNVAPYSFFNAVASEPLTVLFSAGRKRDGSPKDSLKNAQETGEFVVNLVDEPLAEAMNHTSGAWAHEVSEFDEAGLRAAASLRVRAPRVAAAPVALECRVTQLFELAGGASTLVLGEVLVIYVREGLLAEDGLIDAAAYRPVARLGRDAYATLGRVFRLARPEV